MRKAKRAKTSNVAINSVLHNRLRLVAAHKNVTIQSLVEKTVAPLVDREEKKLGLVFAKAS